MKCLLIDDEPAARSRLARMLLDYPDVEVIGEAHDGLDAVRKIERLRPDLLFLDIEMPAFGGFQVLQSLPPSLPIPMVIFVTGYDQHAMAAFEANALAYLLKPVEPERLAASIERARCISLAESEREKERTNVLKAMDESPKRLRQIVCRKRDRMVLVPPEEILWFTVDDGIVKAKTTTELYWVNYSLGDLEAALPSDVFFRARREVLVNVTRIKEIRPYFKSGLLLIMADGADTEIAVSERQVRPLRERIPGL